MSPELGVFIAFVVFVVVFIGNVSYEAGSRAGYRRGVHQRNKVLLGPEAPPDGPPVSFVLEGGRSMRHFDAYVRQLVFIMTALRRGVDERTHMVGMSQELWDSWVEPDVITPVRDLLARRPVE